MEVGSASSSQMMQQMQQSRQRGMEKFDTDASGGLSIDEFNLLSESKEGKGATDNIEELFSSIDADGSGELSKSEMQAHRQNMMQEKMGNSGQAQSLFSSDVLSQLLEIQESSSETMNDAFDDIFNEDEDTA